MRMMIQGSRKGIVKDIDMLISRLAESDGQEPFHMDRETLLYKLEAEDITDTGIGHKKPGVNS
jgi:hypothetical protein